MPRKRLRHFYRLLVIPDYLTIEHYRTYFHLSAYLPIGLPTYPPIDLPTYVTTSLLCDKSLSVCDELPTTQPHR
jgi:hypothetical protein